MPKKGKERYGTFKRQRTDNAESLKNTWWCCHKRFQSGAKRVLAPVYEVSEVIGSCQIVTFCAVLLHFRDPFLTLQKACRLCTERVIVTDLADGANWFPEKNSAPLMRFVPNARKQVPHDMWWRLRRQVVKEFIKVLGF